MKIEPTPERRRALRAEAHHLHPVVMIGNDGLTPAVLHEIDLNLLAHGLIKIRVFSDDRDAREALLAQIADQLEAAPIQHIGKLLVLYRPLPAPEVDTRKTERVVAHKPGNRRSAAASAGPPRRPTTSERRKALASAAEKTRRGRGVAKNPDARRTREEATTKVAAGTSRRRRTSQP